MVNISDFQKDGYTIKSKCSSYPKSSVPFSGSDRYWITYVEFHRLFLYKHRWININIFFKKTTKADFEPVLQFAFFFF